jgi:rubredoxin
VCATCISDPDNTNAFCVKCLRYEETDDSTLCGRCQFIHDSEDEDEESDSDEETSFAVLNPYTVQQLYQNSEGDEDALVTPGTSVFAVFNPYTVQLIYNTNKN